MIDARGFSCPTPVIMVKNAVKKNTPDFLEVLVDNNTAKENILRFAANNGYQSQTEIVEKDIKLTLRKA